MVAVSILVSGVTTANTIIIVKQKRIKFFIKRYLF